MSGSPPLTRGEISAAVNQLPDAWGYMILIDGDAARVHAMTDQLCWAASDEVFLARTLATVVECLVAAQGTSAIQES